MPKQTDHVICKHCRKSFRSITWHHLQSKHGYDGEYPVTDYKRRFGLTFVVCPKTRKKMSRRMENDWAKRGHHWTRARLIAEIRRRHRAGENVRTTRLPSRFLNAAGRLFGSWQAAVERAGLDYENLLLLRKWSREKVIRMIQELADKHVSLDVTSIKRSHPSLFVAAVRRFPTSWGKALRAAGFDPRQHKKRRGKWDRPKAVAWVGQRLKNKRSILAGDTPHDLRKFVRYHLKTGWTEFIQSLGIMYPGKRLRAWSKQMVLEEIRRYQADGQPLDSTAMKFVDDALLSHARRFFKTWAAARVAAGC